MFHLFSLIYQMLTLFWFLHMYIEVFLDCSGGFLSRRQSVPNYCWHEDLLWTLTNFLVSVLCCLAPKPNPPLLTGGQLSTYGALLRVWPQCQHVENSGRVTMSRSQFQVSRFRMWSWTQAGRAWDLLDSLLNGPWVSSRPSFFTEKHELG